jgi:hypothetical protein
MRPTLILNGMKNGSWSLLGFLPTKSKHWNFLKQYLEVITVNIDERDSSEDRERQLLRDDLRKFHSGEREASWRLFRDRRVFERHQLHKMFHTIDGHAGKIISLRHPTGGGGTTFLRNVLYALRDRYVCVSITKAMWEGLLRDENETVSLDKLFAFFGELTRWFGLPVLIGIDSSLSGEVIHRISRKIAQNGHVVLYTDTASRCDGSEKVKEFTLKP